MNDNLICIIGPDGTGKTTQIKLLIDYYKERKIIYEYRWLRFYHFFSVPILVYARICGLSEVITLLNGEKIGYHYFYRSKTISAIYPYLLFLDIFFLMIFKVYLPLMRGKKIICDRFIYDTIIDIMISISSYDFYKKNLGRLFISLIPKKSHIFLLISDQNSLKNRREDVKKDKNLKIKIMLYSELAKEFNLNIINANESIQNIHKQLIRDLNE